MPAPLSLDLRRRFQQLYDDGLSARAAGRQLMISATTASRFGRKLQHGEDLAPAQNRRRQGVGRLVPFEPIFVGLVTQDPDISP